MGTVGGQISPAKTTRSTVLEPQRPVSGGGAPRPTGASSRACQKTAKFHNFEIWQATRPGSVDLDVVQCMK